MDEFPAEGAAAPEDADKKPKKSFLKRGEKKSVVKQPSADAGVVDPAPSGAKKQQSSLRERLAQQGLVMASPADSLGDGADVPVEVLCVGSGLEAVRANKAASNIDASASGGMHLPST